MLEQIRFASDVTAVAFSKNEKQLAIGEKKGAIHVLDLKESWPENSRVAFTPFFFQQHPEYFQGTDEAQRELRLKDLISHTEPNDALEELEQTCDRVVIHFKEPLKFFLYQNEFVREWFDSAGDTAKTNSELPIDVIPKDNSVELRFRTRGSIWTDPNSLRLEERLETWDVHSKRISSVAWGNDQSEVFGFSEDSTVSKLFISTSVISTSLREVECPSSAGPQGGRSASRRERPIAAADAAKSGDFSADLAENLRRGLPRADQRPARGGGRDR